MSFLTEDLVTSVKDRSFAPISQTTFQDADIIRILNEELSLRLASRIQKQREDFFLTRKTISLVGGQDHYLIPERAMGNALKAVFIVDSSGNRRLLSRREIDRIGDYSTTAGDSSEFYFEGDQIVLTHPAPSSAGSMLVIYSRRPNKLIETTSCAKITSVSSSLGTTTFTVDTDLTADLSTADEVDFLRNNSPFSLWAEDIAITAITSTTIAALTTDVDGVDGSVLPAIGDYICPAGFSNIPMVPEEFHPVLAEMACCRMLRSMGNLQKWQASKAELDAIMSEALDLIKNRAEASPQRPYKKRGLIRNFRA